MEKKTTKEMQISILKALQNEKIGLKEAKEILTNGIPVSFWSGDEKLPIRRQAYYEVFGSEIPTIKWVSSNE